MLGENEIKIINDKIINLWHQRPKEIKRKPLLYYTLKKNCVLFIGGNPSFVKKDIKKFLLRHEPLKKYADKIDDFFDFENLLKNEAFRQDHEAYRLLRTKEIAEEVDILQYFKVFNDILKISGINEWEHIDLFYLSETKQKELKKHKKLYKEFFQSQVEITLDLIKMLEPKIIIVVNGHSAKILKKIWELDKIDNFYGTYVHNIAGKNIPVFLSGMLSGMGALDVGSRERLAWHIGYVNKLINSTK